MIFLNFHISSNIALWLFRASFLTTVGEQSQIPALNWPSARLNLICNEDHEKELIVYKKNINSANASFHLCPSIPLQIFSVVCI